jgi:hypothetical protein
MTRYRDRGEIARRPPDATPQPFATRGTAQRVAAVETARIGQLFADGISAMLPTEPTSPNPVPYPPTVPNPKPGPDPLPGTPPANPVPPPRTGGTTGPRRTIGANRRLA